MYTVAYTVPDGGGQEFENEFSEKIKAQLHAQAVIEYGGHAEITDAEGNEIDPWDVNYKSN